jgi:small nuclear ribonucleoprotein (snRNP)-like protein
MSTAVEGLVGRKVVLDLKNSFVYVGLLAAIDAEFIVLTDADAHDLRDTPTMTREEYVVRCREHGISVNRVRVAVVRSEVTAICLLDDVVPN